MNPLSMAPLFLFGLTVSFVQLPGAEPLPYRYLWKAMDYSAEGKIVPNYIYLLRQGLVRIQGCLKDTSAIKGLGGRRMMLQLWGEGRQPAHLPSPRWGKEMII